MVQPWEAFVIGAIGAFVSILTVMVMDKIKVDDPVGAFAVHGAAGIWVRIYMTQGRIGAVMACREMQIR